MVAKAQSPKSPTRFQKNILALLADKTAKNIRAIEWTPEDLPIPGLKFVTIETFFTLLASKGLKLHIDWAPHNCPLCKQLPEVNERIRKLRNKEIKTENSEKDTNAAMKKREGIYLHEAQLHNQRGEIERIRQKLDYHQVLVVSDFAGHYGTRNQKFYQLIFVIYFRSIETGHVEWTYKNVWGKEKAKWELFVAGNNYLEIGYLSLMKKSF